MQIGLDKIVSTKAQVGGLQAQLTEMEPVLIRTQADVEALIVQASTTAVPCAAQCCFLKAVLAYMRHNDCGSMNCAYHVIGH
jgi:hypothetical protein